MTIDTPSNQEVRNALKRVRRAKREFNRDWQSAEYVSSKHKETLLRTSEERLEEIICMLDGESTFSEEQEWQSKSVEIAGEEDYEERDLHDLLDGKL